MSLVRRTVDFYKLQVDLLWRWRPGRNSDAHARS